MKLHCDTGWSLSLDSNPNIFPSQARASATLSIWNCSDLNSSNNIHNKTNLCWTTFAKAHINPSLTHWSPFKGFHSRLLKTWLQNIDGSNFPNGLYTILYIRDPNLDPYSIVHFPWPKSMDNVSLWHVIQACINMALAILTTVLIARSAARPIFMWGASPTKP